MIEANQLGLADAHTILKASRKKAGELGIAVVVAVVDAGGHIVALDRMDQSKYTSIAMAVDKAFTAAGAKRRTSAYTEPAGPGKPAFGLHVSNGGRFAIVGGGVPVVYGGEVVGAVGCASGTTVQDEQIAIAGIEALAEVIAGVSVGA